MIPKVRPWRVRLIRDGVTLAEMRIETVNRRFARWLAVENWPQTVQYFGTEIRISRLPAATCLAAVPACNPVSYSRIK